MLYHNVQVTAHSLRFVDALVVSAAAAGTCLLGQANDLWPLASSEVVVVYAMVNVVAFLTLGSRLHVYHARRTEKVAAEFFLLFEAALYSAALACLATQVFTRVSHATRTSPMLVVGLGALLGLRLVMRLVIRRLRRKGGDARRWLIVRPQQAVGRHRDRNPAQSPIRHFHRRVRRRRRPARDAVRKPARTGGHAARHEAHDHRERRPDSRDHRRAGVRRSGGHAAAAQPI